METGMNDALKDLATKLPAISANSIPKQNTEPASERKKYSALKKPKL
jgi:hypothetical protein